MLRARLGLPKDTVTVEDRVADLERMVADLERSLSHLSTQVGHSCNQKGRSRFVTLAPRNFCGIALGEPLNFMKFLPSSGYVREDMQILAERIDGHDTWIAWMRRLWHAMTNTV